MSPATRKTKRAAAAKQAASPAEAESEERALKKQKNDPQTETEQPLLTEHPQADDESIDALVEAQASPQSIDAGANVSALDRDKETEEQIADGDEGEGEGIELEVGLTGEQEGEDEEELQEAEEDDDGIELGDTRDYRKGDDEDVGEFRSTQDPSEKWGENASTAAHNDGNGATKTTTFSRQDFSSQGKLFIGGLTWETTADTLQNYFGKYGEITDSVVMKNRNTGHPRGFGFVTFADPSVCDMVLKDTHVIDGRTVEAKQTVPRENDPASSKELKSKKIFIGGLTTTTTEEELKAHFEKFGKVVEHQIMQDHKTGRSRGFGFVTFDSDEVVDNILSQGRLLELCGKQVEVKIAEPKDAGQDSVPGSSNRSRPFTNRGGGYVAHDPYFARGGRAGGGRPGGPSYGGDAYGYGGGYSGIYAYGGLDGGNVALGLNYPSFGSGPGYGYNYGGSYGSNAHGYGWSGGCYHPYGR